MIGKALRFLLAAALFLGLSAVPVYAAGAVPQLAPPPPTAEAVTLQEEDGLIPVSGKAFRLYMPMLAGGAAPTCELTPEERNMAEQLIKDPNQRREQLRCSPLLAEVARQKAIDLGVRDYFDHVNPDGLGPNWMLILAGYPLPEYYFQDPDANNVESLAAGFLDARSAWEALLASETHRLHVLGEDPFFAEQIEYGIGYAEVPGSTYQYYWVILTAKR